jgi:hypothetical protein
VSRAALVLVCLAVLSCQSKEQAIQSALEGGMLACDVLLADPSIPRTPEAHAFCVTMTKGCPE